MAWKKGSIDKKAKLLETASSIRQLTSVFAKLDLKSSTQELSEGIFEYN